MAALNLVFSCCLMAALSSFTAGQAMTSRNLYIVQAHPDMKPEVFPTVEQWYSSTLRSLFSNNGAGDGFGGGIRGGVVHVYETVFNGFSAMLTEEEAKELRRRREILGVYQDRDYELHTTRSPLFIGLTEESSLLKESDGGEGIIIGILDTGIWPDRRSFHDDGLGPVPARWKGDCEKGDNFTKASCNRKLVGARFFNQGYGAVRGRMGEPRSPLDNHGHGTHTASTAGGRLVRNVSLDGYSAGDAVGMAPKARIAAYKVCGQRGCQGSDILAGIDKAVADGVDVISLSLGGFPIDYARDPLAIGTFGATEKGVFVSASAGNDGPFPRYVSNTAPWMTTVAAGTIDRSFPATIILGSGKNIIGISMIYAGDEFPAGKFFPVIYSPNATDCLVLNPAEVSRKIVVCDRGGRVSRAEKGEAVKAAGGLAMIIANVSPQGYGITADAHVLPAVAVSEIDGQIMREYAVGNATAALVFHGTKVNVQPAPELAGFSSRGPSMQSPYVIKPDIVAPGVNILAAWSGAVSPTELDSDPRRTEFNILSGTSMSCPHISGLAALLKGAHPDWSPAAIRSALMTTADAVDKDGKPVRDDSQRKVTTVWDIGSGHVNPEQALAPGLVYDLSTDDYIQFFCDSGYSANAIKSIARREVSCNKKGNPWDLNYPSISVVMKEAGNEVTVKRVVTNVGEDLPVNYTVEVGNPHCANVVVEPAKLEFSKSGEVREFTVKITAVETPPETVKASNKAGWLAWKNEKTTVRSPIAITWQGSEEDGKK